MEEGLFREESLKKVKSPESLNDYIKVTKPSIWVVLISVIVLLIGACIWAIFGHVNCTLTTFVRVKNGNAACYILVTERDLVTEGMKVKFKKTEGIIEKIEPITEDNYIGNLSGTYLIDDGYYEGEIVLKKYKPVSFIIN